MKTIYAIFGVKILIILILLVGWVKCLVKFIDCDFDSKKNNQ